MDQTSQKPFPPPSASPVSTGNGYVAPGIVWEQEFVALTQSSAFDPCQVPDPPPQCQP